MKFQTAYTSENTASKAAAEIKNKFEGQQPKFLLFFASSSYSPEQIGKELQNAFPNSTTCGCTTSGEIISGKMLDDSLVVMGFGEEVGDFKAEVALNVNKNNQGINQAFKAFEKYFGQPIGQMDPSQYIGLVMIDGMSGSEERVNDEIGNLTNVTFLGGSAGDDLKFKETNVFLNGEAHSNAALLILLKPKLKFDIIKTQSFLPTDKKLIVTKSNEERREIVEFNGEPAVQAYAKALGVSQSELSDYLFKNPVGLMFGDSPFVRSPRVIEGNSILFYCAVKKDTELTLLKSTDIISDTKNALEQFKKDHGNIESVINFNCILRTLDLKQQNKTDDYGALFKDFPTVGFSTYGESYIGHINQTSTMLVFYS